MIEEERVLSLGEAFLADEALAHGVSEGLQLFFEGRAPGDTILFLFLDVFARHVSCVVEQSHVPLHDFLAVFASLSAVFAVKFLVHQALGTQGLSRLNMEVFLRTIMVLAHSHLLRGVREGSEVGITCAFIHFSHLCCLSVTFLSLN